MDLGAHGERIGEVVSVRRPPTLATRVLGKTTFAATRVAGDKSAIGMTQPIPPEEAFLVSLQLRDFPRHDLWLDGKHVHAQATARGTTILLDLKLGPRANLPSAFDSLHLYAARRSCSWRT